MQRFILSASLIAIASTLLAPAAFASSQASTPGELSEGATIHQLILHNRDVRSKS